VAAPFFTKFFFLFSVAKALRPRVRASVRQSGVEAAMSSAIFAFCRCFQFVYIPDTLMISFHRISFRYCPDAAFRLFRHSASYPPPPDAPPSVLSMIFASASAIDISFIMPSFHHARFITAPFCQRFGILSSMFCPCYYLDRRLSVLFRCQSSPPSRRPVQQRQRG